MARFGMCLAALSLGLASCAYDPPMKVDHASATYRRNLADCQTAGDQEAERRVLASGGLFLTYPVSLPIMERIETRRCLERKGYHREG